MKKLRPEIPLVLVKPIERYAVAHTLSTTSAIAALITAALKQQKYIKDSK